MTENFIMKLIYGKFLYKNSWNIPLQIKAAYRVV